MHNWMTGETRVVSNQTGSTTGPPTLSRDAAYAAFGVGAKLDGRFASTGLFGHFTNLSPSFWWIY